jgi:hypothetical protein
VFYSASETGICTPISCTDRAPIITNPLVCGPFPCFQHSNLCTTRCVAGEGPNERGQCVVSQLSSPVEADGTRSLDMAINRELDKTSELPTVNVIGNTRLNSDVEISGIVIKGSSANLNVTVSLPSTMFVTYNGDTLLDTSIEQVNINITLTRYPASLIDGKTTRGGGTLYLTNLNITYLSTLSVPLITLTSFDDVVCWAVAISKRQSNADDELMVGAERGQENICGVYTDSPAILLSSSNATFNTCSFTNIDTGYFYFYFINCFFSFFLFCFV